MIPSISQFLQDAWKEPFVQWAVMGLIGMIVMVALGTIADFLRYRGKSDVERATMMLEQAKLSPEAHDDAMAELALARAKDRAQFLNLLASRIEAVRIPLPTGAARPMEAAIATIPPAVQDKPPDNNKG